jgi:hypothetical protein
MKASLGFFAGVVATAVVMFAATWFGAPLKAQAGAAVPRAWGSVKAAYQGGSGAVIVFEDTAGVVRVYVAAEGAGIDTRVFTLTRQ